MRRAGLIAAASVGALAVAAAVAWFVAFRDTAEPVSVDEAVTSFRGDTEPRQGARSPVPEGVYVYATRGYETIDALTGVTHRYPRRTTITVAAHDCGMSLTWQVLKGRSTEWVYCVTATGWQLRSQDERHTFFGRTERTTYVCEDTPIRPARAAIGASWRVSCSTDGAAEAGTARIVERRRWELAGGPRVTETLVRKSTRFTGRIRGTAHHDLWFDSGSAPPMHIAMKTRTTTDSPIGGVGYEEDVALTLVSPTPRR